MPIFSVKTAKEKKQKKKKSNSNKKAIATTPFSSEINQKRTH